MKSLYHESGKIGERDAVAADYAVAAMGCRSALVGSVKRFGIPSVDAELVVDEAISKGLEILLAQAAGELGPGRFRFGNTTGYESWLRCIVGRPYAGPRGGVTATHVRRARSRRLREVALDDVIGADGAGEVPIGMVVMPEVHHQVDVIEALERVIRYLAPRERFIVEARFAIPATIKLDPAGIHQRAIRAGITPLEARRLLCRAKRQEIRADEGGLTVQQIAALLDLSARQAGRLLACAVQTLRSRLPKNVSNATE